MTQNEFIRLTLFLLTFLNACPLCQTLTQATGGGNRVLLKPNIGISAMHMQLLNNDRVVIFDRTNIGRSNISLPDEKCRVNPNNTALLNDCTAHSVEYDVTSNSICPLKVLTDVWCSSRALIPDGHLIQTGGFNDGDHAVRIFCPCIGCDWEEIKYGLTERRWYATNQILPDGRQIIIGGRRQFNCEFYPKIGATKSYNLPFLVETKDQKALENNLYPFVFLNIDGNLFIFANNRAILFDYLNDVVVKQYPPIPDGNPRNYPSTGSVALLPLKLIQGKAIFGAEVLVCGGASKGSYISTIYHGKFIKALDTCARLKVTDPSPHWVMETMPTAQVMGDMMLLPNGNVLIINGGSAGTADWELGRNPVLTPVVYRHRNPIGSRFERQNPSSTPRMYHSSAVLLRDGWVLISGSNPNKHYIFEGVVFPTELSVEAFLPSYLNPEYANLRPKIISPVSQTHIGYNQRIAVRFTIAGTINMNLVSVTMVAPSFNTHSFAMNQRLLVLGAGNVTTVGVSTYETEVMTPGLGFLAPSGFYMLFVVHQEIPSLGIWVHIQLYLYWFNNTNI